MIAGITEKLKCAKEQESLPTVLVAVQDGLHNKLIHSLTSNGYLVLHATNQAEVLHLVISQTRRIHLLVADAVIVTNRFAGVLKRYRCEMQLLFVPGDSEESLIMRDLEMTSARVRQLLEPSKHLSIYGQHCELIGAPTSSYSSEMQVVAAA